MRAADLIGQLADPLYLRLLNTLYYEFLETGMAERCGYTSPMQVSPEIRRDWERFCGWLNQLHTNIQGQSPRRTS